MMVAAAWSIAKPLVAEKQNSGRADLLSLLFLCIQFAWARICCFDNLVNGKNAGGWLPDVGWLFLAAEAAQLSGLRQIMREYHSNRAK